METTTLADRLEQLKTLNMEQLRIRYRQLFGEDHPTKHRQVLIRHIAWRLQSLGEGGLSERARNRAEELASNADIRVLIPRNLARRRPPERRPSRDPRLPAEGTLLRRSYQGRGIEVRILADGFEYETLRYESLSAIAAKVTGTRWNGFLFFGLADRGKTGRRSRR
jgi:hypothetical protein